MATGSPLIPSGVTVSGISICSSLALPLLLLESLRDMNDLAVCCSFEEFRLERSRGVEMWLPDLDPEAEDVAELSIDSSGRILVLSCRRGLGTPPDREEDWEPSRRKPVEEEPCGNASASFCRAGRSPIGEPVMNAGKIGLRSCDQILSRSRPRVPRLMIDKAISWQVNQQVQQEVCY